MTRNSDRLIALVVAIFAAAALRLLPHPPNFTPIGAIALFSGAYLGRRWLAFAAPLGALLLSDAILGFYDGMIFQYAAFALVTALGWLALRRRTSPLRLAGAASASAILFFTISNLGVWATSGMYPLTMAGLGACFIAALPFFQNNLFGDLLFSVMLFGGFALAEHYAPAIRQERAQPA